MKSIKLLIILIASSMMIISCDTEDPELYDPELITDQQVDFEALLLSTSVTELVIEKTMDGEMKPLGAVVALAGAPRGAGISYSYEITDQSTTNGINSTGTGEVPAGQTTGVVPIMIDLDQFEIGVPNTISIRLTDSGVSNTDGNTVDYTFTVVCPSDLGGIYDAMTVGQSTDDCCPDEVTTMGTIELTGEAGAYTISDFSGGLYLDWYGVYGITEANETDGSLNGSLGDVCGQLSGSASEPFGTDVTITGTVDADTGVITYTWVNGYDDTGTVTLTPQ